MNTVETTLETEYLDTLEFLITKKRERTRRIEALESRIEHELYRIKCIDEKMKTNSENYHKDVVNTVEAALCS